MAPLLAIGAVAMQKFQEQQAKREAERQALADQYTSRAAKLGQPTDYLRAIGTRQDIDAIEGPNYLGLLMDAEEQRRKENEADKDPTNDKAMGAKDYFSIFSRG